MSKSIPVLLSNLPIDTLPRTSFLQKGLLRTLRETSTGNFSKIYMPVDKARNCNIGVAVVRFASEEEAGRSISALNGVQFGGEDGNKLMIERLDGSNLWRRLVDEGKVDENVLERLECLEVVGFPGSL